MSSKTSIIILGLLNNVLHLVPSPTTMAFWTLPTFETLNTPVAQTWSSWLVRSCNGEGWLEGQEVGGRKDKQKKFTFCIRYITRPNGGALIYIMDTVFLEVSRIICTQFKRLCYTQDKWLKAVCLQTDARLVTNKNVHLVRKFAPWDFRIQPLLKWLTPLPDW